MKKRQVASIFILFINLSAMQYNIEQLLDYADSDISLLYNQEQKAAIKRALIEKYKNLFIAIVKPGLESAIVNRIASNLSQTHESLILNSDPWFLHNLGKYILVVGARGIGLWDLESKDYSEISTFRPGQLMALDFICRGEDLYLLVGCRDGELEVVRICNKDNRIFSYSHSLGEHEGAIANVKFIKDGNYAITVSYDGTIGIWDINKIISLEELRRNNTDIRTFKRVKTLYFRPEGWLTKYLVADISKSGRYVIVSWVSKNRQEVAFWDLEDWENIKLIKVASGSREDVKVKISPDEKYALVASDKAILVKNLKDLSKKVYRFGPDNYFSTFEFTNDGKYVLAFSDEGLIAICDLRTGICRIKKTLHTQEVETVNNSACGRFVLTCANNKLGLTDFQISGNIVAGIFNSSQERVNNAIFSQDGKYIITSSGRKLKAYETPDWIIKYLSVSQLLKLIKLDKLDFKDAMQYYKEIKQHFNKNMLKYIDRYLRNKWLNFYIEEKVCNKTNVAQIKSIVKDYLDLP